MCRNTTQLLSHICVTSLCVTVTVRQCYLQPFCASVIDIQCYSLFQLHDRSDRGISVYTPQKSNPPKVFLDFFLKVLLFYSDRSTDRFVFIILNRCIANKIKIIFYIAPPPKKKLWLFPR